MAQKAVQTIGELHQFLQREMKEQKKSIVGEIKRDMVTKKELGGLEKRMDSMDSRLGKVEKNMATKKELSVIERNMATKAELSVVRKDMATKDDLGALFCSIDNIESNFVREDSFAEFRDKTFTRLDKILGRLKDEDTEEKAEEGGLARVSDDVEKNSKQIKANHRDINDIKLRLKAA